MCGFRVKEAHERKKNKLGRMRSRRRLTVGKGEILLISSIIITPAESQGRKRRVDLKYGACKSLLISCCTASDYKIEHYT